MGHSHSLPLIPENGFRYIYTLAVCNYPEPYITRIQSRTLYANHTKSTIGYSGISFRLVRSVPKPFDRTSGKLYKYYYRGPYIYIIEIRTPSHTHIYKNIFQYFYQKHTWYYTYVFGPES